MHFHVRIILHCVGIPLQYEDGFSKVKNAYNESAYYSICDDYGVNAYEIWINGDRFYTTAYDNFGDGGKATQRSPTPSPQEILHVAYLPNLNVL